MRLLQALLVQKRRDKIERREVPDDYLAQIEGCCPKACCKGPSEPVGPTFLVEDLTGPSVTKPAVISLIHGLLATLNAPDPGDPESSIPKPKIPQPCAPKP